MTYLAISIPANSLARPEEKKRRHAVACLLVIDDLCFYGLYNFRSNVLTRSLAIWPRVRVSVGLN
jgi:hypothetical protein